MINEESLQAVHESGLNRYFGKPLYDTYGFAQIPKTVRGILTGDSQLGLPPKAFGHLSRQADKVILLFLDAFGWRFLQRTYDAYPFLERFERQGVISKLTTQFPSTTTAHITLIHSGLPVGESGLYEWYIYEPTLDSIIVPLNYAFAGDKYRNTLKNAPINPKTLYPRQTVYHELAALGIKSYVFQSREYTPSPFSDVTFAGAQVMPYKTLPEALTNLTEAVLREKGKAYYFLYFDGIDSVCHTYGPESAQVLSEIDALMTILERQLWAPLAGAGLKNTMLLVTADHGQTEVDPDTTVFVNQTLPTLEHYLKRDRKGNVLAPAGSARDLFLHVRPDAIDDAQASLERHLDGKAEVFRVSDLMAQGFFGPVISDTFRARVADLVVLPYRYQSVWWYEKGKFEQNFYGHHGGLTPEEMETIFLAYAF